jgi:hypothetical protein
LADIFISYSQQAPEPTQALAADLMARRYSVWFDTRLLPKDTFGEVIDQKIDNAKAVIVIWSPPALTSKWVRGEATRGENQGKLICLRTAEVDATRLPTPFNLYNARLVTDRAAIYDALAELGAHPGGKAPNSERDAGEAALAWDHVKDSGDIELFEQFLKHYGEGHLFYGMLAKKKLAELSAGSGAALVIAKPAEAPLPQAGDAVLRIEPGMHTAMIRRIGVDAAGTLMVTGSDDKTARLWALPEGGRGEAKLKRTLRVPLGEGDDGKVFAVALSPDGQWVAAGGWDAAKATLGYNSVYIFEAATGRLVTRLRLGNAVAHLTFSPDGSRLAATLGGGEGMRLWETGSWRLLAEDKDYGGKRSNGAAFDGANRLFTVAYDGRIRRHGADGRLEAKAKTAGGAEPFSVAVHPKGARGGLH